MKKFFGHLVYLQLLYLLILTSRISVAELETSGDGEVSKRNEITQAHQQNLLQQQTQQSQQKLLLQNRATGPSYPEIINKSVEVILRNTLKPQDVKDILNTYYFTTDKEKSIWPKAIEETEKALNLEFTERELSDMENDVKSIFRRMMECDFLLEGKKKKKDLPKVRRHYAKCYSTLQDYIEDGFNDFRFQRGTVKDQGKILQMNLAYNMMSLLVLRMSQAVSENAQYKESQLKAAKAIIDMAENVVNSMKTVTKNTIDARIQAISQIEICLMQEVLWQEFQVTCEFRMKRELFPGEGIGGSSDPFIQKYRAKVIDEVTKKEVCNIAMNTTGNQDKNKVKRELTKKCAKLRDTYARNIQTQIRKFYADRTLTVVEKLPTLWNSDAKKLKEIKTRLSS